MSSRIHVILRAFFIACLLSGPLAALIGLAQTGSGTHTNGSPPNPATTTPPGMIVFGQNGLLESNPGGFNIVIPDSRGGLQAVPLDQLNRLGSQAVSTPTPPPAAAPVPNPQTPAVGPSPPPGITTPEAAAAAARAAANPQAGNSGNEQLSDQAPGQIQSGQLGTAENPFVCECRCPVCPTFPPGSEAARAAENPQAGRVPAPNSTPFTDPRQDPALRDFYGPLPLASSR